MSASIALPPGHRLFAFQSLDSTNAEALRRARRNAADKLWIWARTQTAGRGRAGRTWDSPAGNLHASLLLRLACPLDIALQLAFVAGLSAYDAVAGLMPGNLARRLALKWPNDLLLDDRKLAGILLESATSDQDCIVAIGTGLNLAFHPFETLRPATSLSAHGISIPPEAALERLAATMSDWLAVWHSGEGFDRIRSAWEARAIPVGRSIRVRLPSGEEEGIYAGIDASGSLRLLSGSGVERRITAGDVFIT